MQADRRCNTQCECEAGTTSAKGVNVVSRVETEETIPRFNYQARCGCTQSAALSVTCVTSAVMFLADAAVMLDHARECSMSRGGGGRESFRRKWMPQVVSPFAHAVILAAWKLPRANSPLEFTDSFLEIISSTFILSPSSVVDSYLKPD